MLWISKTGQDQLHRGFGVGGVMIIVIGNGDGEPCSNHGRGYFNKNLFLRKKSSRPCAALDQARVEKGEIIPENTAPKSYLLFLSRTTIGVLSTNSGTKLGQEKIASRWISSIASGIAHKYFKLWWQEASQEIKPKSNESMNSETQLNAEKISQQKCFVTRFLNSW